MITLFATLDWADHIEIPDMDEDEVVDSIEWQRANFGEKHVSHWFVMEVST